MAADQADILERVMEHAQKQFKEQKFSECLQLFTRALSYAESMSQDDIVELRKSCGLTGRPSYSKGTDQVHHPKLASLLDSRAATFEKLRRLKNALEDAEQVIRVEPFNARGYIRAGKLLQLMEQDKRAYEIYERGIAMLQLGRDKFKMRIKEQMYTTMKEQRRTVRVRLIPKKAPAAKLVPIPSVQGPQFKKQRVSPSIEARGCLDPLSFLPLELIHRILELIPLKSALRCRQLCHSWDEAIRTLPLLNDLRMTSHIEFKDIRNCFKLVEQSKEHSIIKRVRTLVIPSMNITEERRIFNYILTESPVKVMDTLDWSFMDVTMQELVELLQQSSNALRVLRDLKNLRITCLFVPRYEEQLLELLPRLESITMIPAPGRKQPALPKGYTPPTSIFANLKHLTIIGDLKRKYPSVPFEHLLARDALGLVPSLESLIIVGYDWASLNSTNGTFNFLQSFPELRTLVMENNSTFTLRTLLKSHDVLKLPHLKKFVFREPEVRSVEGLQVYVPEYLSNIFGNLQVLDLTGSSISYQGLVKLLETCGLGLKHLSLGFCPNIAFKRGPLSNIQIPGGYFGFQQVAMLCPLLESLYLNQSVDFGDYALTEMTQCIKDNGGFTQLKLLDLSFNTAMSGYKILDLLKARKIPNLILHGVNIKPETIKMMERQYCKRVQSRLDKQYWREYGVNSYNPF